MKASRLSRWVVAPAPVLLALLVSSCASSDERPAKAVTVASWPAALPASVAHRDARLGTPSFVWINRSDLPKAANAREAVAHTLRGLAATYELREDALATLSENVVIHDQGDGPIIARMKQTLGGIEVFRGGLNVLFTRELEPVSASGLVAKSLAGAAGGKAKFALAPRAALDVALALAPEKRALKLRAIEDQGPYARFDAVGLEQPARVKKVFFPEADRLIPAYYTEMMFRRGGAWSFVVAADDGRELFRNDMVKRDAAYRVFADPTTKIPYDGPMGNAFSPHTTGKPDNFKAPLGPPALVTLNNFPFSKNDPWLPQGANQTLGNNVRAYADLQAPDGLSAGDAPGTMTAENLFGSTFDTSKSPSATAENVNASATQLFYTMNFLHDWFYDAGFDEKSGNHQASNFGRGGAENDPLLAEAQDSGDRNNADAATPSDGGRPRVQMYVWSGLSEAKLVVNTPANIAGTKPTSIGSFGKDAFDLTGDLALGDDGSGADALDACEPVDGVQGKIALVHRGTCSFVQKAQNVQNAGGIGIIVANVASSAQATTPPYMGGTSSTVTIPALSVALADGQALEAAAGAGVSVHMTRLLQTDLDGSLDTTVVAHEWGHVLSNRLIGDGNGLTSNQSGGLGEGWGDFIALMVLARQDDPGGYKGVYVNAGYATGGIADSYFGTRRLPYSTDFTKNALTFKHIANGTPLPANVLTSYGEDGSFNAEVHSAGEVWATMLWEAYASLLVANRGGFAETQKRMKQYLVAAMKLTPVEPTFLEARDALLAAALAANAEDYRDIYKAFARRGAGVGAEGPGKDSADNVGVKESFEVKNHVQIGVGKLTDDTISCDHDGILDPFEVGTLELVLRNDGLDTLSNATAEISGKTPDLRIAPIAPIALKVLKPFESQTIKVPVSITSLQSNAPVELAVVIRDPVLGETKSQTLAVPTRYASDEAPESSTIDTVETRGTSWNATKGTQLLPSWTRVRSAAASWWAVPDQPEPTDVKLTSPSFTIEGTTFTLSFKHRWSYRFSTRRMVDVDGGVVEVSVDGGKTFKDANTYGKVDYNTTLDNTRGDNALKGRSAYGNKSAGYPDKWITSKLALDLKAHPESVIVRFRSSSSTGFSGAPGWEIDDISLEGITSKPFYSFVPQADACDENGPTADAGGAMTVLSKHPVTIVGAATHPADATLVYQWIQESGAFVETKQDGANLSFVAPEVKDAPIVLGFALRAHDGKLLSAASRVQVTVVPDPSVNDSFRGGCACRTTGTPDRTRDGALALGAFALLALAAVRRRRAR